MILIQVIRRNPLPDPVWINDTLHLAFVGHREKISKTSRNVRYDRLKSIPIVILLDERKITKWCVPGERVFRASKRQRCEGADFSHPYAAQNYNILQVFGVVGPISFADDESAVVGANQQEFSRRHYPARVHKNS